MRASGHALGDLDALIAAVASSRRFSVATRDVRPFTDAGLTVIDPFGPPPEAGRARTAPRA